MTSTVFVDQQTIVQASWLNDVNNASYLSSTLLTVSGSNTIVATTPVIISAYANGQTYRFTAASANTGATTININGLGAVAITKSGSTALSSGDIVAGSVVQITYSGTGFQLIAGAGSGGGGSTNGATNTFAQSGLTVAAGTGMSLVGPITFAGTNTVSGRLVIL